VLQSASFVTLVWAAFRWDSDAIAASARFLLVGLPIWIVLYLVFNQMRRVRAEELETEELRRAREGGASTTIFEIDSEELLIEEHRLKWMVRWMLPSATVLVALMLLAGSFVFWGWALDMDTLLAPDGLNRTESPTEVMWFAIGVGFFCFLFARYGLALARLPSWRILRAGAGFMAGNALACLGLAITLMSADAMTWTEPLFAAVLRVAMGVLGLELALNFLLDFYRPRAADTVHRPSFDSRLLGLIGEPGGFAKSIADAVNYQFGFEVSSTWFYQLLQRWMFPMMAATAAAVLALTSVVVVDASERAVIERFGRPAGGARTVLAPGLHFKWPFPIDVVYRASVAEIGELVLGEATESEEAHKHEAIVWTEAHDYVPEVMLLVASKRREGSWSAREGDAETASAGESVPVSLLMFSVTLEYRIKNIEDFLYTYDDPVMLMECVAHRFLSDYAASVDIDELMGPGREEFNVRLAEEIQARLDELGTGIELVFAGIRGAHPPARDNVAASFQRVVSAQTNMAATINAAEGEARKILTAVAGTESLAMALDAAIRARDRLRGGGSGDAEGLAEAERQVDELLGGNPAEGKALLSGEAAVIIAGAQSEASSLISGVSAKAGTFKAELAAYEAAPELYMERKKLDVYAGLGGVRKYLIVGDPGSVIIEYAPDLEAGLDQVLTKGLEAEE